MTPLDNQLFRFSLLRGPDAAVDSRPVTIMEREHPGDDRAVPVVEDVVTWMGTHDLTVTTAGDLSSFLQQRQGWPLPATVLQGMVVLAAQQARSAATLMYRDPGLATRSALVASCDVLTAAALLEDLHDVPAATPLAGWVAKHPVTFGGLPTAPWRPRRALARGPAVMDYFVVRERLLGYEMGEIEDIKNYLKGESKEHRLRHLSVQEEETFRETEQATTRTKETATQQRSSMKAAAQDTAESTMGLDARVKTDGQYGPTRVSTDVGFQFSSTSTQTRQTASEFSADVLRRSVEEVRERELQRTTRRTRTEIEENREHSVDNTLGAAHTVGIYRWVDSVWEATTYSVGPRLVLELLIPEPGRAVLPEPEPPLPPGLPPAPTAPPDDLYDVLDAATAAKWAAAVGAEGVKAPPLPRQVIGVPFGSTDFKDQPADRISGTVVKDVKVPDGYVGETVFVAVTGMNRTDTNVSSNIVVDVPGGKPPQFVGNASVPNPFMVSGGPGVVGRPNPDMHTFVVQSETQFGPGATVPVTIQGEDLRGITGYVEVHCVVSSEAQDQWKLDTVLSIHAAYRTRLAEWEALRLAATFQPSDPAPTPDLDALCRHVCISSLLGTWPSAANLSDAAGWPKPGALSGEHGDLIAFMEQAFEWTNMQYVAYPHYWADAGRWDTLMGIDHPDPHVREFLRSGAVRMIVPVRLDLSEAVLFFLDTGLPWFGRSAPIPGEAGYLDIADELRTARAASAGGETAVSTFQYRLPTSLTILQESGTLPAPPA